MDEKSCDLPERPSALVGAGQQTKCRAGLTRYEPLTSSYWVDSEGNIDWQAYASQAQESSDEGAGKPQVALGNAQVARFGDVV